MRSGELTPLASWALAEEITDVLGRPKLRRYRIDERDLRDVMILLAPLLPDLQADIEVRDPDDAAVVAAAIEGRADAIVTGDADLLGDAALVEWLARRGVEVLTPAELLARLS